MFSIAAKYAQLEAATQGILAQTCDLSMPEYLAQRISRGQGFCDALYGQEVQLGELTMLFLDTPPVQRLRWLKQLGCSSFVFPNAEHSRFPHSVGVAYLAGQCAHHLWSLGQEMRPIDMELIEVAGLLHDIGHGPFSHMFEGEVLPTVLGDHNWSHEAMSASLLEWTVDTYHIDIEPADVKRVQDIITNGSGISPHCAWGNEEQWKLQIVANAANGLDVDKCDYLHRDAKMTGVGYTFDFRPLMLSSSKVVDGQICFHESSRDQLVQVFDARAIMHRQVYQHRKAKAAEYMVVDVMKAADPVLGITRKIHSCEEFLTLDDTLLGEIKRTARREDAHQGLKDAAAILRRLECRQLYPCVAEASVPQAMLSGHTSVTAADVVAHQEHNVGLDLQEQDIIIHNMKIDHCKGQDDPLRFVQLYDSWNNTQPAAVDNSRKASFLERKVRVFLRRHCQDTSEESRCIKAVGAAFTRAMQQRFGHNLQIEYCAQGSRSTARGTGWQQQWQQQVLQQQLPNSNSSSQSGMRQSPDAAVQRTASVVENWSPSQQLQPAADGFGPQQQQQLLQGSASDGALTEGEFVAATDDEEAEEEDRDFDMIDDEFMMPSQQSQQERM